MTTAQAKTHPVKVWRCKGASWSDREQRFVPCGNVETWAGRGLPTGWSRIDGAPYCPDCAPPCPNKEVAKVLLRDMIVDRLYATREIYVMIDVPFHEVLDTLKWLEKMGKVEHGSRMNNRGHETTRGVYRRLDVD